MKAGSTAGPAQLGGSPADYHQGHSELLLPDDWQFSYWCPGVKGNPADGKTQPATKQPQDSGRNDEKVQGWSTVTSLWYPQRPSRTAQPATHPASLQDSHPLKVVMLFPCKVHSLILQTQLSGSSPSFSDQPFAHTPETWPCSFPGIVRPLCEVVCFLCLESLPFNRVFLDHWPLWCGEGSGSGAQNRMEAPSFLWHVCLG